MDQEEYKHVCRLCNKKYPSGKSLGGHMRSHVISNTYVPLDKLTSKKALRNHLPIKGKKFKNIVVAGDSGCGGGKKWRVDSTVRIKQEMESHSYYEKKSAKEGRYSAIALIDSCSLEKGCSSSKSETEVEQEQVALCLMMLSRDSTHSHRIDFLSDHSATGYFENGAMTDDSAAGYARNYGIKNPKSKSGSECDVHDSELGKRLKKSGKYYSEKTSIDEEKKFTEKTNDHLSSEEAVPKSYQKAGKYKTHQALRGHTITHKRDLKIPSSTEGHCCPFCHKVFRSGQALGGHKRSHLIKSSSQDKPDSSVPKNQHLLFDLNLPASQVEENSSFVQ